MKLLREVPTRIGRPRSRSSPRRRSSSRLCSTVLPKPIPGSTQIRSSAIPSARRLDPLARKARTSSTDVAVGGVLLHRPGGSPSMCMSTTSRPRWRRARQRVARSAVTSLTIRARVERGLGDVGLRGVDRDGEDPAAGGSTTRRPVDSSSSPGDPGRGAQGATRRRRRPCRRPLANRWLRPCRRAASASRYSPPSENESGVTLTMPIEVLVDLQRRSRLSGDVASSRFYCRGGR